MAEFAIRDEYITLGQLLKATDIVQSGAEVKEFLATERILVNGEQDGRRGRKLRRGDRITGPKGLNITIA